TAGKGLYHDGRFADGAEASNVSSPIINMVGHGNSVVSAGVLARITAVLVLRTTALLSAINVIGAAIAVNGANKCSTMMAKISNVPFQPRIGSPTISTGGVVAATYKAVV